MLAVTQLQALNGPVGPIQCLSGLLAFTMARSNTLLQAAKSFNHFEGKFRVYACVVGPFQCLSGLIAFPMARSVIWPSFIIGIFDFLSFMIQF